MVIVDSNIWIHYLRTPDTPIGREMVRLLDEQQVAMVGVVLTEVLQGASGDPEFDRLRILLGALPYLEVSKEAWVRSSSILRALRNRGRLIPLTDALIAALALEGDHQVYSLDDHLQRVPRLRAYEVQT